MKACCFTGYRPEKSPFQYDNSDPAFLLFSERLKTAIQSALDDGYDTFYCGGAKGFDLFAAETLLSFRNMYKFSLIMALPYRKQSATYPENWKIKYFAALLAADETVVLSEEYHSRCFDERNRYMVDRSGLVIAFCDGKRGGTLNTIRYARKNGKTVCNIADNMQNYSLL